MSFTWGAVLILTVPTVSALIAAIAVKKLTPRSVFWIAALILPASAFFGGLAFLIYFLNAQLENAGGNGPAFFGILFIIMFGPPILIFPGALSGWAASSILRHIRSNSDTARSGSFPVR